MRLVMEIDKNLYFWSLVQPWKPLKMPLRVLNPSPYSNDSVSMAPVPCKVEITMPALYGCWKPKSDQESIVQHLEQDKH